MCTVLCQLAVIEKLYAKGSINHIMSQIYPLHDVKQAVPATKIESRSSLRRRCDHYEPENESTTQSSLLCSNPHEATTSGSQKSDVAGSKALAQVMKRSHWKINTSVKNKRADFSEICSICLVDSPKDPLIAPCLCLGKRSHQHKRCIEDWIEQTGASSCPFCHVRYEYTRKRKSFWSYVKDCELEHDFLVSITAFAFSLYLFIVGLAICCHYVVTAHRQFDSRKERGFNHHHHHRDHTVESERLAGSQVMTNSSNVSKYFYSMMKANLMKLIIAIRCWLFGYTMVQESVKVSGPVVAVGQDDNFGTSSRHQYDDDDYTNSWLTMLLFCFVCSATVVLFIAIVSMSMNIVFRHYVRYWLWSETHFKVEIKPYDLSCTTTN